MGLFLEERRGMASIVTVGGKLEIIPNYLGMEFDEELCTDKL